MIRLAPRCRRNNRQQSSVWTTDASGSRAKPLAMQRWRSPAGSQRGDGAIDQRPYGRSGTRNAYFARFPRQSVRRTIRKYDALVPGLPIKVRIEERKNDGSIPFNQALMKPDINGICIVRALDQRDPVRTAPPKLNHRERCHLNGPLRPWSATRNERPTAAARKLNPPSSAGTSAAISRRSRRK